MSDKIKRGFTGGTKRLSSPPSTDFVPVSTPAPPPKQPDPIAEDTVPTKTTKCVYFSSPSDLARLEKVVESSPSCSVSRIVSQLVRAFLASQEADTKGARCIVIENARIYI